MCMNQCFDLGLNFNLFIIQNAASYLCLFLFGCLFVFDPIDLKILQVTFIILICSAEESKSYRFGMT